MNNERLNNLPERQDFSLLEEDILCLMTILESGDVNEMSTTFTNLILSSLDNLNQQYESIKYYGCVISFKHAAAKSFKDSKGPQVFFKHDGSNISTAHKVYTLAAHGGRIRTVYEVGCFDGFDILTCPDGSTALFMGCAQGERVVWQRLNDTDHPNNTLCPEEDLRLYTDLCRGNTGEWYEVNAY